MAKPQLENGHTRIANELLEQLMRIQLSPNQWQVLLYIIRKTYGFNKKVDRIANFQIQQATGLCKTVVSRVLRNLHERRIIERNDKHLSIQKDWEQWQKLAEQSTPPIVSSIANQSLLNSQPKLAEQSTKVSSTAKLQKKKETIQKKLYKRKYGEFRNVLLTAEEYQKLRDKFGDSLGQRIEDLSHGIASKDYKYKSHYAAILSWDRKDKGNGKVRRLDAQSRREYKDPDDYR
jgi:phage replication O-like protein O